MMSSLSAPDRESMIDLQRAKAAIAEAQEIIEDLHGRELVDHQNITGSQAKSDARTERAQMSQDLQLLATRLELAAALVRIEYWWARGESDPLTPDRER